jgi:putative thioredoxin
MTNFGGAFDLSSLNKKPEAQAGLTVTDWIVMADEQVLRSYLQLSEQVPVLMLITDGSEESNAVRELVYTIISQAQGRFAGIEVDLNTSPQLAQAIGINQAPAMAAIMAGQPAPLFKGNINQEQLVQILGQVLQLGVQNNITGSVTKSDSPQQPAKQLTPEHMAAIEAVDRGDLTDALAKFEKLVVEYPSDQEIRAGLAQVQLLKRLQDGEEAGELTELFTQADKTLISGQPKEAFEQLLNAFAIDFDNRDLIRTRLLDLFIITGDTHESVLKARQKLASLMF